MYSAVLCRYKYQCSSTYVIVLTTFIVDLSLYGFCIVLWYSDISFIFDFGVGLKYGTKACCGHGSGAYNFDPNVYCGNTKVINGKTVTATPCSDPYNYVSWDGIHASEAANKLITQAILNGSYFDPHFPLHALCDLQPIGWRIFSFPPPLAWISCL